MSSNRPSARAILRLAAPLLVLAALSACALPLELFGSVAQAALTSTEQFKMTARERPDEVRLAAHATGLSQAQIAALTELADRWLAGRGPQVTIQSPIRGASAEAVATTRFAAQALLVSLGVPAARVAQAGYEPSGDGAAPVIVGFRAYEAVVPRCGQGFDRVNATHTNLPMENFGCAVTANMAAQLADPGDLVSPRDLDAPPADRRAYVLDKYRQGKITATTPDPQGSGAISSGVPTTSGGGGG